MCVCVKSYKCKSKHKPLCAYLLNSRAVQDLGLKEDNRVRAAYTGEQQTLGIRRATRISVIW